MPENDNTQLMLHLVHSPVTIEMYACEPFVFKNFGIGVFKNRTRCSETVTTHTAAVIGYGENENGDTYWELLNSYGKDWGHQGIIRLARYTQWDSYGGQNGILEKPMYGTLMVKAFDMERNSFKYTRLDV